jgi:ATP-binding protein involved in chromosome partitioning
MEGYGLKAMSMGFMVEEGTPIVWRGPMVVGALNQMLREVLWGDLDVLVIDMPPGTGDVQLTIAQQVPLAGVVVVSTPQDLALIDATRAIDMFRKMDVKVIGLIENMAGYACPHCGEVSDPFGSGGAQAAAGVMDIPFLGRIPLTLEIRRASDAGNPPAAGDGEEAALFRELAGRLLAQLGQRAGGLHAAHA